MSRPTGHADILCSDTWCIGRWDNGYFLNEDEMTRYKFSVNVKTNSIDIKFLCLYLCIYDFDCVLGFPMWPWLKMQICFDCRSNYFNEGCDWHWAIPSRRRDIHSGGQWSVWSRWLSRTITNTDLWPLCAFGHSCAVSTDLWSVCFRSLHLWGGYVPRNRK